MLKLGFLLGLSWEVELVLRVRLRCEMAKVLCKKMM
jgi:hypothetical protein